MNYGIKYDSDISNIDFVVLAKEQYGHLLEDNNINVDIIYKGVNKYFKDNIVFIYEVSYFDIVFNMYEDFIGKKIVKHKDNEKFYAVLYNTLIKRVSIDELKNMSINKKTLVLE